MKRDAEILDKGLPCDPLAERSVLGTIALNHGVIKEHDLRDEHFHQESHKLVFHAMARLVEDRVPCDTEHVYQALSEANQLDAVGGAVAVAEMLAAAPIPSRLPDYVRTLHDLEAKRRLHFAAIATLQDVQSTKSTSEIIADLQRRTVAASAEAGNIDLGTKANVVSLSTVKPQRLEWLWESYFPLGKFCLTTGDPGDGKTLLMADVTARVTTESAWPCGTGMAPLGKVLLICCEDDPADTIRPRLEAAGADLTKVDLLAGISHVDPETGDKRERMPNLQTDIPLIREILDRGGYKLVVLDTVTGFLGKVDNNSSSDIRNVLTPLAVLAADYRVCVVGIQHLTKDNSKQAKYRVNGSVAYTALARSVIAVTRDHADRDLRLMLGVKGNLGPSPATLGYRICARDGVPFIDWLPEPIDVDVDQAMGPPPAATPRRDEATTWLEQYLAAGPQLARDAFSAGESAGHTETTIKRAKRTLGVRASKLGLRGAWQWDLPNRAPTANGDPLWKNTRKTVTRFEVDGDGLLHDVTSFEEGQPDPKEGHGEAKEGHAPIPKGLT